MREGTIFSRAVNSSIGLVGWQMVQRRRDKITASQEDPVGLKSR